MKVATRGRFVPTIREEFDRLFRAFNDQQLFGPPSEATKLWLPALDFSENDKEYLARVEVPGIPKENLEVTVEGRLLTIAGRREFQNEKKTEEYFWREREEGRFSRTVELPAAVDPAKVVATCDDGVMTIRLPKSEPSVKNQIPVK
jgi:HSP20 family protein